jgi:hypothetical protein
MSLIGIGHLHWPLFATAAHVHTEAGGERRKQGEGIFNNVHRCSLCKTTVATFSLLMVSSLARLGVCPLRPIVPNARPCEIGTLFALREDKQGGGRTCSCWLDVKVCRKHLRRICRPRCRPSQLPQQPRARAKVGLARYRTLAHKGRWL